jgi:arylsulfatase A-like enzyme
VIHEYRYDGYETDVMTDLAIKGMKQFKQPFLMMMQFFNAHRPFDPPQRYEHLYDKVRIPEPGTFWDDYQHPASPARAAQMRIEEMPDFRPPASLTGRQRKQWNYQQFMAHLLGTLRSQDENVGRLLDFLDSSGLADNTIVVYTCDHGFFLGDHGWFDKRWQESWVVGCRNRSGRVLLQLIPQDLSSVYSSNREICIFNPSLRILNLQCRTLLDYTYSISEKSVDCS